MVQGGWKIQPGQSDGAIFWQAQQQAFHQGQVVQVCFQGM
jgi:hypothetical protein